MSSSIASQILYIRQVISFQVACLAALLYDYVLLFGSEVDLIWVYDVLIIFPFIDCFGEKAREWNSVTLLYAIVRYFGFVVLMFNLFYYCNMIWSPTVSCLVWFEIHIWGPYVYRFAMEMMMMKRVYALSNPNSNPKSSRLVVGIMVTAFIAKYVLCITFLLLGVGPGSQAAGMDAYSSGTHICATVGVKSNMVTVAQLPTFVFEALLFMLAFGYFVSDVWASWRSKEPGMWKVSRLVQILVRDSTIYFAITVATAAMEVANAEDTGSEPRLYVATSLALQQFLPYCFSPRLIFNMKEQNKPVMHESQVDRDLANLQSDEHALPQLGGMWPTDDAA